MTENICLKHCEITKSTHSALRNLFVPNAPVFVPPGNIRKPYGFLMFLVGRGRVHWE